MNVLGMAGVRMCRLRTLWNLRSAEWDDEKMKEEKKVSRRTERRWRAALVGPA